MGLFGVTGPKFQRFNRKAFHLLQELARDLENRLRDTPNEWLVLQAAGMAIALDIGGIEVASTTIHRSDHSIEATMAEASAILASKGVRRLVTAELLEEARQLESKLRTAIQSGDIPAGGLIGTLDNLVDHWEQDPSFRS